jgi:hypothetical protein
MTLPNNSIPNAACCADANLEATLKLWEKCICVFFYEVYAMSFFALYLPLRYPRLLVVDLNHTSKLR